MEMKNEFEVFDFNEEDEISESTADKYSSKFKNPNFDDPAKLEYRFLECVANGVTVQRKEMNDSACVDVDAIDGECSYDGASPAALQGTDRKDPIPKEGSYEPDVSPESKYMHGEQEESRSTFPEQELRDSCAEASSPGKSPLNNALHNPPLSNEPVDLAADFNASMSERSASTTASDIAEDDVSFNDNVSDHCFGNIIEDDLKGTVVICLDYVLYQGNYYTGGSAIFSPDGIKIKGPTESECQVTFSFERGIDDIITIDCQWFQRFAHMVVNLKVLSMEEAENAFGLSVVEELKFAVNDPRWSEKQEAITSLNVKYLAIWNIMVDQMIGMDGDESPQHKSYFPNFDKPFEEVIYPKGDFDAVSISKRDVDLLQPETFINDTIVDFYIKYLKNQIQPEGQRFHFFNSFFFRKLADLDKDPSSISDGRAAFLRVRKWTRKLDMFGKDYIFVPVNFSLHWSLIVICHPGEVATFKDEDLDKSSKLPCILHMDSIKGNHAGLKNLVQSYLWEEWKERHKEASEDLSSKFLNLRFVSLELPQQENSFDCGLFLLHYLELFLAEAPLNFNPFKITKYSNFLNMNWFPPTEASLKRTLIQKLIFELLDTHSQENSSSDCSGEPHCSKVPEKIENETGVEFISETLCQGVTCHGNLNSQAGQGIEMTLLASSSSMRHMGSVNDSGLVLREFFEPGAATGSLLGQFQSFEQPSSYYNLNGSISPTEQDDVQTGQQYVYLASGENGFSQFTGMTPQAEVPYSSRGFVMGSSWNHEISMQGGQEVDSSFEETSCASDDDENDDDVGIIENIPIQDNVEPSEKWEAEQLVENVECLKKGSVPPASSEVLDTSNSDVSEASEGTRIHHSTEFADLPSKDNPPLVLHQTPGVEVNQVDQDSELFENNEARDVHMNGDAMVNDLPSEDNSTVSLHQNPGTVLNQLHQDSELAGKNTEMAENNDDRDNDVKTSGDPAVGDNVENEAIDVPMIDDAMANDLPPEENLIVSSHQNPGTIVNRPDQDSETKEAIGDELLSETAEQPAAKKIRLTPPEDKED